jgi:hypothetical protein
MTRQRRRVTQREKELLAHVRQAQARKLSLAEYCRTQGLNVQCFYNLRYRLRGRSEASEGGELAERQSGRSLRGGSREPHSASGGCRLSAADEGLGHRVRQSAAADVVGGINDGRCQCCALTCARYGSICIGRR